ncbi:MAG: Maf family protein, partial [Raoultibacter sp.]
MDTQEQKQQSNLPDEPVQPVQQPERIDVILASGSPRRKELLEKAGVRFVVHVSEVDEQLDADLLADPPEAAKKLAERKAGAVVQEVLGNPEYRGAAVVIGADTRVVLDGTIFG